MCDGSKVKVLTYLLRYSFNGLTLKGFSSFQSIRFESPIYNIIGADYFKRSIFLKTAEKKPTQRSSPSKIFFLHVNSTYKRFEKKNHVKQKRV